MKKNFEILLESARQKVLSSIMLVEASLENLEDYDAGRKYTPKELEPYHALSDRFIRAVEACIKLFKTYEYYLYTVKSDTYRDLLLNIEKQKIISSVAIWIDMRDIRNRIVHDYLPNQIKDIFDLVMGEFKEELLKVKYKIETLGSETKL
jgi:uncharacterized protein YutE (UPF0331/DUF86 family)